MLWPISEASTILEGKDYPTSNLVLPYIYTAIAGLQADAPTRREDMTFLKADELHSTIVEAREALYNALLDRWVTGIDRERLAFYAIATLLDPRFLDLPIPLFTNEMRKRAYTALRDEYAMQWAPAEKEAPPPSPSREEESELLNNGCTLRDGSLSSFMSSNSHLVSPLASTAPTVTSPKKSEVDEYLSVNSDGAHLHAVAMDYEPLDWWSRNESRFPHLALMAQQYLGTPASSASCERVFSLAGRLFSDLRQSMHDGTLEERMWAKVNRHPNK